MRFDAFSVLDVAQKTFARLASADSPDWRGCPWASWIDNAPLTKSALGQDVTRAWLESKGYDVVDGPGGTDGYHLQVEGKRVAVHFGIQGKNRGMQFSALRGTGMGIDLMILMGVMPKRIVFWFLSPEATSGMKAYKGDIGGLYTFSFKPTDELPYGPSPLKFVDRISAILPPSQMELL